MESRLSEAGRTRLAAILGRGAVGASDALSRWLGRPIALTVDAVEVVEMADAAGALGAGDALVAACAMELTGGLSGGLLLVFEDRSGLALVDLLTGSTPGTATSWGELEASAARETANIVGCAYVNALASSLPGLGAGSAPIVPGPPAFRHEFAASLLEFALMDQAMAGDRLLLVVSGFSIEGAVLDWRLVLAPDGRSLRTLLEALDGPGVAAEIGP